MIGTAACLFCQGSTAKINPVDWAGHTENTPMPKKLDTLLFLIEVLSFCCPSRTLLEEKHTNVLIHKSQQ